MKSLLELNNYSSTSTIEYSDVRPANVVFATNETFADYQFTASTINTILNNVVIDEIINYVQTNLVFTITIESLSEPLLINSVLTNVFNGDWPSYLKLVHNGDTYTYYGFRTASDWNFLKLLTWTLPDNWPLCPTWYLNFRTTHYDANQNKTIVHDWNAYDPQYAGFARIKSISTLNSSLSIVKHTTASVSSSTVLELIPTVLFPISLSCSSSLSISAVKVTELRFPSGLPYSFTFNTSDKTFEYGSSTWAVSASVYCKSNLPITTLRSNITSNSTLTSNTGYVRNQSIFTDVIESSLSMSFVTVIIKESTVDLTSYFAMPYVDYEWYHNLRTAGGQLDATASIFMNSIYSTNPLLHIQSSSTLNCNGTKQVIPPVMRGTYIANDSNNLFSDASKFNDPDNISTDLYTFSLSSTSASFAESQSIKPIKTYSYTTGLTSSALKTKLAQMKLYPDLDYKGTIYVTFTIYKNDVALLTSTNVIYYSSTYSSANPIYIALGVNGGANPVYNFSSYVYVMYCKFTITLVGGGGTSYGLGNGGAGGDVSITSFDYGTFAASRSFNYKIGVGPGATYPSSVTTITHVETNTTLTANNGGDAIDTRGGNNTLYTGGLPWSSGTTYRGGGAGASANGTNATATAQGLGGAGITIDYGGTPTIVSKGGNGSKLANNTPMGYGHGGSGIGTAPLNFANGTGGIIIFKLTRKV